MFSFLRKKRRLKEEPAAIAKSFVDEFVLNDDWKFLAEVCAGNPSFELTNKARIYRFALVLVVLLSKEKEQPSLIQVRENLEAILFGEQDELGIQKLENVKAAMADLNNLIHDRREMSWARDWLKEVGIEESNPVTLALFSIGWMGSFEAVKKTVEEVSSV